MIYNALYYGEIHIHTNCSKLLNDEMENPCIHCRQLYLEEFPLSIHHINTKIIFANTIVSLPMQVSNAEKCDIKKKMKKENIGGRYQRSFLTLMYICTYTVYVIMVLSSEGGINSLVDWMYQRMHRRTERAKTKESKRPNYKQEQMTNCTQASYITNLQY